VDLRAEARRLSSPWDQNRGVSQVVSRNREDLSTRFSHLAVALAELPEETVTDGEVVALDQNGRPSFAALQNGLRGALLRLLIAGRSVQRRPLEERRQLLRQQVMPRMAEIVSYSEALEASVSDVIAAVKEQGPTLRSLRAESLKGHG